MDLFTSTFGDSTSRCPHPTCTKPGLCRTHRDQLPESILEEFDYRQMARFFKYRLRLSHLCSTADAPSSDRGPASEAARLGSSQGGSATGPSSRVAASSIRTVCMYCSALIRDGEQQEPLSHGVCQPCFDREAAKLEVSA